MVAGLTGSIASGKSLVAAELKRLGAHVVDADLIAREVVEPGSPALKEIEEEFGPSVIKPGGELDRAALGRVVFSDPEKLKTLNRITHPRIIARQREMIEEIKKSCDDPLIIVDAAILIEAGEYKRMDAVIVVYSDEERLIERLAGRGLTRDEALSRVRAQMGLKERLEYADYVIYNNGAIEETLEQTRELYLKLRG
ncbi:MAG: dephospho-CoA kinase [Thermodesulfobacteriota bacterium]|nr:MAG: dephospho-CoA kinase [Thermodesulfobacteriota bacterium]